MGKSLWVPGGLSRKMWGKLVSTLNQIFDQLRDLGRRMMFQAGALWGFKFKVGFGGAVVWHAPK